jgi:acetoin utilization deacetylase AcuC-like enzyme
MLEESDIKDHLKNIPARKALKQELMAVHSSDYVELIESTDGKDYTYLDPDTRTSAGSYLAALLAAGGLCEAVSKVQSGEMDNAFALVRPPGHHAEKSRAMGFCLFNNIAIAARYAQEHLNLERIAIIDWDLHHGNGTQHSFENDPSILYLSTHQFPYYPGTGSAREVGTGAGEGFTVNVPLSAGYGDGEFITIFETLFKPVIHDYSPDMILVSAGFDTYSGDPLGGMNVTPEGYAGLTRSVMEMAASSCNGKVVFTLEGGYNIQGQRSSVKEVLKELSGITKTDMKSLMKKTDKSKADSAIKPVRDIHCRYWKNL